MFMSDGESAAGKNAAWMPYEMPSVDAVRAPGESNHNGFVLLELTPKKQTDFVPLLGNPGKSTRLEKRAAPTLEEKTVLIEKEAYDKGFAQGEKDGNELGTIKAGKIVEKIEILLDEMTHLKSGLVRQCEKDMLATIFAIAEKVIHTHVQLDDAAVKETILAALELTAEKREITLKINPEDFEYVEKLRPELFSRHMNVKSIMITSDPGIARGGCRLETESGDVDATIESQLEIIQRTLKEAYLE